ncbi:MAG: hypothetical protein LBG88_00780 [Christensenellaceae bacterium]|jgi:hypothetical protein|nr:hypothetical protein [Christensenellaceae bacterium]
MPNNSIKDWVVPTKLESAGASFDKVVQADEIISDAPKATEPAPAPTAMSEASGGGFSPEMLMGLLGDQNPMMSTMMSIISGEKPDMMSLLPLFMQLNTKKESAPQTLSLDDYKIIS